MDNKRRKTIFILCGAVIILAIAGIGVLHRIEYPKAPRWESGKRTVMCIGDSITYGDGVWLTRGKDSYPAILQQMLGDDYQVLNYGLNGRTLLAEGDDPYTEERFYRLSLETPADVILIMLGSNDSKPQNRNAGDYLAELCLFTESYRKTHPDAEIYLMQPSRCFPARKGEILYDISNDVISSVIYDDVAAAADECGTGLIDLYALTEDHPGLFADGIHPNADGNRTIAEFIYNRLSEDGLW